MIRTCKERLLKAGAIGSIFDAVNRQLSRHGYIVRGGQMIDASIVQAPKQSMSKEEKAPPLMKEKGEIWKMKKNAI